MTSDVSEVLLPCPFCGGDDVAVATLRSHFCVQCGCEANGPWRRSPESAITAWNTRAQPAVLAVPVDDQNLMDEQHLRYCDRNIEASQAKGDADGVSFWHQWKAEYQRRIAAAPAIHEGGEG